MNGEQEIRAEALASAVGSVAESDDAYDRNPRNILGRAAMFERYIRDGEVVA